MQVRTLESITAEIQGAPYLEEYFGLWAIDEDHFLKMHNFAQKFDLHVHMQTTAKEMMASRADSGGPATFTMTSDGIAVIPIKGSMMKQASSFSGGTGTVETRRKIRAAAADPLVRGILLAIESPGGTVAGNYELAADINAAKSKKPTWAFCEDMCASAAYWAASQTDKIFANKMAVIGSIGTYGVVYDSSSAAEKQGVKVHVVRAGEFKGSFMPGTQITDAQLAEYKSRIDQMNSEFINAVQIGRKLTPEKAKALADGRAFMADEAVQKGLIDGVQSLEETLSLFAGSFAKSKGPKMETPESPKAAEVVKGPATVHEIKSACPGASADFVMSQLEKSATLAQATSAYMEHLATANSKLQEDLKAANAKASEKPAAAPAATPGAAPVTGTGNENGRQGAAAHSSDPVSEWESCQKELMKEEGLTKAQATKQLQEEKPELYQAYLTSYNKKYERNRLMKSR